MYKKHVTALPTTEVQKYKISSSARDVQDIIYLTVCDRSTTRNKTRKERAEKDLTIYTKDKFPLEKRKETVAVFLDLREVGGGGDWMELAQDRERWRALVNTVMNLWVP